MSDDTKLSKLLSWLLRHGAKDEERISIDAAGFVKIADILKLPQFSSFTLSDIENMVKNNDKKRFTIEMKNDILYIRANQGHSFPVEALELTPIDFDNMPKLCLHGTFLSNWQSIKTKGLSKMSRQHIHMAPGLPGDDEVISGMRQNCDVIIYINMAKAMRDDIGFFQSSNNVILSTGNKYGVIPPEYFTQVLVKQNGLWKPIL